MTTQDDTESLNELINCYIDVLDFANNEPFFSIKGFVMLYLKIFWWEINFIVLPFILLANFFIFLINYFKRSKLLYFKSIFIKYFIDMYNSFKEGEITALKLFTLRFLTKLLIYSHIKSKLSGINKGLSLKEIEYVLKNADKKQVGVIKKKKGILKYFEDVLPSGTQFKILFSSLTTIAGSIAGIYSFIEKNIDTQKKWSFDLSNLNLPNFFVSIWIFSLVISILSLVISCFIRKREILLQYRIYEKEQILSQELRGQIKKEFPYDLVGWIIIIIGSIILNYFIFKNIDNKNVIILESLIVISPLIYALIRRVKLNRI
jgi:hypothetical protein